MVAMKIETWQENYPSPPLQQHSLCDIWQLWTPLPSSMFVEGAMCVTVMFSVEKIKPTLHWEQIQTLRHPIRSTICHKITIQNDAFWWSRFFSCTCGFQNMKCNMEEPCSPFACLIAWEIGKNQSKPWKQIVLGVPLHLNVGATTKLKMLIWWNSNLRYWGFE